MNQKDNTVRINILPKAIYRLNAISSDTVILFTETGKNNPKICMKPQKAQAAKEILRKKNKTRGITPPDFKPPYQAIVIETAQYQH